MPQKPFFPLSNYLSFPKFSPTHKTFHANPNSIALPTNDFEALSDKNWKQVMEALKKNKTRELVSQPEGKKAVGCICAYTVKYEVDKLIEMYKTGLVAEGFT